LTTDDAPADVRMSALETIYTCLESALRLIHPVMPFVSEDLWQRLPRRPDEVARTIMLCEYPREVGDMLVHDHR
jgi:valyl-tRNA synthetase